MDNVKLKLTFRNLAIAGALTILIFIAKAKIQNASVEMKIPYVALNMVLETQIAITENEGYLENLEKKTGMSRKKIKKLFKYLSKNKTRTEILENAKYEISKSLTEIHNLPGNKKLDFFVINILAPYLTIVVNNFEVNDANEKEIQSIFAKLFDIPQDNMNPLQKLTEGTYRYNTGGSSNLGYKYELNNYLKKKRFYLDYDNRKTYANIFKIDYVICMDVEWRHNEKISIFVLKRIYPNILRAALGYAPAWSSDVVVIKDLFSDVAKEYKTELKNKKPKIPQGDANANRIRYELTYKDLNGISHKQMERNLIILTAIHEAKHRIDEIEMPGMRLNLDLEVSAYLTSAILGEYPFLELRKLIEWAEAYYRSTGYTQLRYLLAELWALADNSLKQDYSKEHLKAEMRKIYENYRTIQEEANFIDLNEFEQRMLSIIFSYR